jgi:homoserine O-acetyltransferase
LSKYKSYPIKTLTIAKDGNFTLESEETFGPITIAYETWGTLNEDKSNAILIIHALTGDTHVCSAYDKDNTTPGWWDNIVGPGKAIDTDTYFVICSNYFGGCSGTTGSASIDPKTGEPYGLNFPIITVRDMLNVQKVLIDHLGIKCLKAIIGGSLGGMLVLEWSVTYPDMMENAIVIASSHRSSSQVIAFGEVGRNSIMADPDFQGGNYYGDKPPHRGLSIARMLAHITYLSKDAMESKFGRDIKEEIRESDKLYGVFGPMFQVESYLRYQGKKFVDRFDANSYMYITKAMDMYDISRGEKTLTDVLNSVRCRMLVISFTSDWHFPPSDSWDIVKAMMNHGRNISYVNIESPYGHDAFLIKNEQMERMISSFISRDGNGHETGT